MDADTPALLELLRSPVTTPVSHAGWHPFGDGHGEDETARVARSWFQQLRHADEAGAE